MITTTQLEVLTSAGLIRRARKALDKTPLQWGTKTTTTWHFEFEKNQGQYNHQIIENSCCNCPATGLCKHIIAAAIVYIEDNQQRLTSPTRFIPPAYSQPVLFQQAGKTTTRLSYKTINALDEQTISVTINSDHLEVCWPQQRAIINADTKLNSIVLDGGNSANKLTAALLYLASTHTPIEWPNWLLQEQQTKHEKCENDKANIKAHVKGELIKLASIGIATIQPANLIELVGYIPLLRSQQDQTQTLKQISNGISALQEWVELNTSDNGLDPTAHILRQLGLLYCFCESTHEPIKDAQHAFKSLNVFCIGGHKWFAPSGALGLNMVFLSDSGRLFHASLARRKKGHGFSPEQAWSNHNLWFGSPINYQLPGKRMTFTDIGINRWGSLEIDHNTPYLVTEDPHFPVNAIVDWERLKEITLFDYALLKPKRWLYCEFNETTQELELQLEDDNGAIVVLRQSYTKENAKRILTLLEYWKENPEYIVVRHTMFNHSHQFEPISIFNKQWVSLDFNSTKKENANLLQRLIQRFKSSKEDIILNQEDSLLSFLQQVEKTLREYPTINADKIQTYSTHFRHLGLDLLAVYMSEVHSNVQSYLKITYLVNSMITFAAPWPIYKQNVS